MKATKYQKKSQIRLEDLLRRRKTTLKQFLKDRGITTYENLANTCSRLGVTSPDYSSFISCNETYVSNPAAGIIVIPPPAIVHESSTGNHEINDDVFINIQPQVVSPKEIGLDRTLVVVREAGAADLQRSNKNYKNKKSHSSPNKDKQIVIVDEFRKEE